MIRLTLLLLHYWLVLLYYREFCLLHYQLKVYYIIGEVVYYIIG